GFGFPYGSGSSVRIVMVGRALLLAGTPFRVLHCGPSPLEVNTEASGVYKGIAFEYTTGVRRPKNGLARRITYLRAVINLTMRLARLRRAGHRAAVWLYIQNGPTNLYVGWLCWLLGWPVIQELCEWWPGHPNCSSLDKRLYNSPAFFRNAAGAIAISSLIETRIQEFADIANPRMRSYLLPAIVDMDPFLSVDAAGEKDPQPDLPQFVWCGTAEGYDSVLFLVRVVGRLARAGYQLRLVVLGACSDQSRSKIATCMRANGVPPEMVTLAGYVDDARFRTLLRTATALLLPLDNNDRSRTRFPNKLGEYLASGRPIVSSAIGDLTRYLTDGVNAYLAEAGDEQSFADQMALVLKDRARADRIGDAGRTVCADHLDYRVHADALAAFFQERVEDVCGIPVPDSV
ncbi:MAG TPA: glycosyltransferase family 4 protein, partial [Terriglobia bacterium]|nr:glycosyltransferase family 4 protein [Terriglobia bacterium]